MDTDKKVIKYYSSFYEVSKELTQKQFYDFNMAIYEVMFFDKHIESVIFDDKMLNIIWKSIKHSMEASLQGFCNKANTPYDGIFDTLGNPLSNPLSNPLGNPLANNGNEIGLNEVPTPLSNPLANNVKVKVKVKVKEKGKGNDFIISDLRDFSFKDKDGYILKCVGATELEGNKVAIMVLEDKDSIKEEIHTLDYFMKRVIITEKETA